MESKYKERAIEFLNKKIDWDIFSGRFPDTSNYIVEAMCQLAEEVEQVYKDPLVFGEEGTIQKVYSKAYVEELLQKQRELCAERLGKISYPSSTKQEQEAILNAKLKKNE